MLDVRLDLIRIELEEANFVETATERTTAGRIFKAVNVGSEKFSVLEIVTKLGVTIAKLSKVLDLILVHLCSDGCLSRVLTSSTEIFTARCLSSANVANGVDDSRANDGSFPIAIVVEEIERDRWFLSAKTRDEPIHQEIK